MDIETHKQWELQQNKDDVPTFESLEQFLQNRWQSLEMIQQNQVTSQANVNRRHSFNNNKTLTSGYEKGQQRVEVKCFCCPEIDHKLIRCPKYNSLAVTQKKEFLRGSKLCFNCLSFGHSLGDCISVSRCKECKAKHHTSIHANYSNTSTSNMQNNSTSNQNSHSGNIKRANALTNATNSSDKRVLLATAIVHVQTSEGETIPVKALIDGGSENAVITNRLVVQLGLEKTRDGTTIKGIGDVEVIREETSVKFKISSHVDTSFSVEVEASTMQKISDLPFIPIYKKNWSHLSGIKLADPKFDSPSQVDILLGAKVYEQIILDGLIPKKEDSPTAQNSRLGWLLIGVVKSAPQIISISDQKRCMLSSKPKQLDELLRAFWEVEEIAEKRKLTVKEQEAEQIYTESVSQGEDGRYVVALPFDPEKRDIELGESKKAALQSLFRMENRFKRDKQLHERYNEYMKNLIEAGHVEVVPRDRMSVQDKEKYYLPHHAVIKEESLTTKLRVVFDASRKSSTGVSLNDKLLVGPKTQDDLYSIIIRWRLHRFVYIADVEKMYRQVEVIKEHRDFQRLLWRFEEDSPIKEYRITRVIDGTSSASF